MTAATITTDAATDALTFTEASSAGAGIIERGQAVLSRARNYPWPDEDRQARKDIGGAIWYLADTLAAYSRLRNGIVRPHDEIPGLEPGPDAFGRALAKVAADASRDADEVARVIGKHCGDEAAAFVSGTGGGAGND